MTKQVAKKWTKKSALFAGSFDPPTFGHWDVIQKACAVFDVVHVGIAASPSKTPMFSAELRQQALRRLCAQDTQVEIHLVKDLTFQFALSLQCTHLIRSLRNGADFDYELQMAIANQSLSNGRLETWFVAPQSAYLHISSTLVRDLLRHGADCSKFVPPEVLALLPH